MHRLCFYTCLCLCLTHALYGLMYAYGACTVASRVHRHIYEGAHAHLHVRVSTSICAHQCSTHTHSCAYGHVYTYHPQRYTHRIIYTYTPIYTIGHLTWRFCLPVFQEFSCRKRTVFKVLNYSEYSRAERSVLQAGDWSFTQGLALLVNLCPAHVQKKQRLNIGAKCNFLKHR